MLVSDNQCQQKKKFRQRDNDGRLMASPSKVSDEHIKINNVMLFARPLSNDSVMAFSPTGAAGACQWGGVIFESL